jgi:hypothetical protein
MYDRPSALLRPDKRLCFVPAGILVAVLFGSNALADSPATTLVIRPATGQGLIPAARPVTAAFGRAPVENRAPITPIDDRDYPHHRLRPSLRQVMLQPPATTAAPNTSLHEELAKNPCAAMDERPLGELGIAIALPDGKSPDDPAAACWRRLNESAGPLAAMRCWPMTLYNWEATCLCHRPLYFEQINLERHGYGCCEPLQPLASAAHFFGTVPALPYCMAVECPCECVYTLGHYRPGSCPPWRHHWPPCSPLAAAAEGGVWTGMIFLIP